MLDTVADLQDQLRAAQDHVDVLKDVRVRNLFGTAQNHLTPPKELDRSEAKCESATKEISAISKQLSVKETECGRLDQELSALRLVGVHGGNSKSGILNESSQDLASRDASLENKKKAVSEAARVLAGLEDEVRQLKSENKKLLHESHQVQDENQTLRRSAEKLEGEASVLRTKVRLFILATHSLFYYFCSWKTARKCLKRSLISRISCGLPKTRCIS